MHGFKMKTTEYKYNRKRSIKTIVYCILIKFKAKRTFNAMSAWNELLHVRTAIYK